MSEHPIIVWLFFNKVAAPISKPRVVVDGGSQKIVEPEICVVDQLQFISPSGRVQSVRRLLSQKSGLLLIFRGILPPIWQIDTRMRARQTHDSSLASCHGCDPSLAMGGTSTLHHFNVSVLVHNQHEAR
jgi:hypothetical protein